MSSDRNNVKAFGKRVLVKKERIDIGGLVGTPALEEDGMKNTGRIMNVGSHVRLIDRIRGIRKGAKIHFRKYFVCNDGTENPLVFVDVESITGIEEVVVTDHVNENDNKCIECFVSFKKGFEHQYGETQRETIESKNE